MQIFDISRSLNARLAPWPGDTSFQFELKWKMAEGAAVNVGAINMSLHNGTHADAPFHFNQRGASIEQVQLDCYLGQAVVVDLTKRFAEAGGGIRKSDIEVSDLEAISQSLIQAPRLLFKTGVWSDSTIFPDWIPVMAPGVVDWLKERKVKLVGLDLPSVDPIEAKKLTNHYGLAGAGIAIVESLDLSAVEPGVYQFAALPLKIAGGDAGPVRAILWLD